jgi:hypothetical protein
LLTHFVEEKIEGTRRRERRHKQLLEFIHGKRRPWNVKKEATDRTVWTNRFGKRRKAAH